jgi:indolepyruvate ferredoxin oxidoreductase
VVPVETKYGRKRRIDQSTCNKDYSCLEGFCPSFVTVLGAEPKKRKPADEGGDAGLFEALPEPELPPLDDPYGILVTGVGGTGVVTIGAILTMAAHIEGKGSSVLDMTGLAQKGGAVVSHVKIAADPERLYTARLAAGGADLVIGGDTIVSARGDNLSRIEKGRTEAVVNSNDMITGDFTRNPDYVFPGEQLRATLQEALGAERCHIVDATGLATALLGDSIAANIFMVGYAWQKGLVPVTAAAIERALELNKVAVDANKRAFLWGRRAAHDLAAVIKIATRDREPPPEPTLDGLIEDRTDYLAGYQNRAYGERYRALVERVREAEAACLPGSEALTTAVARYYFKLLAYKDEYEVARLFTGDLFRRRVDRAFESGYRLNFHLAPPVFAKRDDRTGHLIKKTYGGWVMAAFRLLAKLKWLRGTALDPFGRSEERRRERALIGAYEETVAALLAGLKPDNHALAVEIASVPEQIRGFGHIKEAAMDRAVECEAALLAQYRDPSPARSAAE